jgi:hypothetical protein
MRQPNPYRSPTEQTVRAEPKLGVATVVADWPHSAPATISLRAPSTKHPVPGRTAPANPEPTVTRNPSAPPHKSVKPDPKKIVERKTIANIHAASTVARVINGITEGGDVIDALYDALPDSITKPSFNSEKQRRWYGANRSKMTEAERKAFWRKNRDTLPEKLEKVIDHYGEINIVDAIENIAKNQIEDRAIGGLSKAARKSNEGWYGKFRRPVGLTTGPAL